MAYETKVILKAIGQIIKVTKDPEKIYKAVEDMANAEGVVLPPYEEEDEEPKREA